MSEISSKNKAYMAPIAIVAGLGIVGMGLVSDGVAMADSVTDTINVSVTTNCTFNSASNMTYAGSAANGTEVNNFNDSGQHVFNLFCNDSSGFVVTATPHDLQATGTQAVVAYTDDYSATGVNSLWTANITSSSAGLTVVPVVPASGGTIVSSDSNTPAGGVTFTATYDAYVGSETPAGVYTGTIIYTLTPTGSTNSGSNSQNSEPGGSEQGGEQGGSEQGGEQGGSEQGGEQGGSEQGGEQGGSEQSGTDAGTNSTPNKAPLMTTLTNNYPTYNTYNTSYPSGGSTASTFGGSNSGSTTSGNEDEVASNSGSSTNDSYEKPLGVTTAKASANKDSSGVDPAPIIAAGVLVVSGIAAIALAKNGDKEENKN